MFVRMMIIRELSILIPNGQDRILGELTVIMLKLVWMPFPLGGVSMLKGKVASEGRALGKALKMEKETIEVKKESFEDVEKSIEDFHFALEKSKEDLEKIRDKTKKDLDEDHAEIFDAHIEMVEDPEIKDNVEERIKEEEVNPAYAYKKVTDEFKEMFAAMDDEYMKERAADIADIQERVIGHLTGKKKKDTALLEEDVIIIAKDLSPSDTAALDFSRVKGFVTEKGGVTSHTAIIARAFNIPALVGVEGAMKDIEEGVFLFLDASKGRLTVNPEEETIREAKDMIREEEREKEELQAFAKKKTKTKDGHVLPLFANIGTPEEIVAVKEQGAEGIGLFRTEFLFMEKKETPSLAEQIEAYQKVFDSIHPVIVRTLDVGGDKDLPYLDLPQEENPFLGVRAIRLSLQNEELFKTQLKALLIGAKESKDVRIMFPMIATVEELMEAKRILAQAADELQQEQKEFQKNMQVGIMVEIPSAALNAKVLARHVDFMSIGTNDLIQYTFAADRMNEALDYLHRPFDPALWKLMKMAIKACHEENVEIGVCGEMAGETDAALLFAGLSVDELSMSAGRIPKIRKLLSSQKKKDLVTLSEEVLALDTKEEIEERIAAYKQEKGIR